MGFYRCHFKNQLYFFDLFASVPLAQILQNTASPLCSKFVVECNWNSKVSRKHNIWSSEKKLGFWSNTCFFQKE